MGMGKYAITAEEYEKIKEAERATKDKRISCRLRVLMLRYEGRKQAEVAEMLQISRVTVAKLCKLYHEVGLNEYIRIKYTSHNQALTNDQEQEIFDRFEAAANAGQILWVFLYDPDFARTVCAYCAHIPEFQKSRPIQMERPTLLLNYVFMVH